MFVRFLFIGEGSSDAALVRPLEELCIRFGVSEVQGIAPDLRRYLQPGHTVREKVEAAYDLEPDVDVLFVHRDADEPKADKRISEIRSIAIGLEHPVPVIPVVPVQETESWALLDEDAIRKAADNPNGTTPISIPSPSRVESISDPKSHLQHTLITASGYSGRHLRRFKRRLNTRIFSLIEQIDIDGPIQDVPSWQTLVNTVEIHVQDLLQADSS